MVRTEILSVRHPQWVDENRTAISCWIKTNALVQEVPFTAMPYDQNPHGRELFARCLAGEFGEVATPKPRNFPEEPMPSEEVPAHLKRLESFLSHANLENARKSLRSVVILWASFLDGLLDELLEAEALRASAAGEAVAKPPKTFGRRIKRAFAAGIIDQEESNRCDHIRRIRNAAAHDWELALETEGVLPGLQALYEADHSEVLVFHEDLDYLLQQVYSASCAKLIMRLLNSLPAETG